MDGIANNKGLYSEANTFSRMISNLEHCNTGKLKQQDNLSPQEYNYLKPNRSTYGALDGCLKGTKLVGPSYIFPSVKAFLKLGRNSNRTKVKEKAYHLS